MHWLQFAGVLLEGVGVLVALFGVRSRFRDFAPPGRSEFDPAVEATRRHVVRFVSWGRARFARLFRRPMKAITGTGSAHISGAGSVRARGRVGYGPLPGGRSNKPALTELDRRTRELLDRVSDVRDRLEDEMARIDGDLSALREELQAGVARLEDDVRRLATGDVALQYVGLGMVGLGLILQVTGSVIEAAP